MNSVFCQIQVVEMERLPLEGTLYTIEFMGFGILIFLRSWIWNQRFLHRFYSYFSDHSSAAHKSEPICISPSDTVDKSHLKKSHIYLASFCKQLKMTQFFQIRMVSKSIIMGNCRASGIRENGRFLTFWNEKKCKTWIY